MSIRVSGTWRSDDAWYVRVSGVWKKATKAFVRVGGVWKERPFGTNMTLALSSFQGSWGTNTFTNLKRSVTRTATVTDAVGTVSYSWSVVTGVGSQSPLTITNNNSPTATVSAMMSGNDEAFGTVTLVATDSLGSVTTTAIVNMLQTYSSGGGVEN